MSLLSYVRTAASISIDEYISRDVNLQPFVSWLDFSNSKTDAGNSNTNHYDCHYTLQRYLHLISLYLKICRLLAMIFHVSNKQVSYNVYSMQRKWINFVKLSLCNTFLYTTAKIGKYVATYQSSFWQNDRRIWVKFRENSNYVKISKIDTNEQYKFKLTLELPAFET